LSGARLEKAVGRQGGDAGLQVEGFGHARVWRGLRFLTCKRFFGAATVGAVSKRFLASPTGCVDTGWEIDFFVGRLSSQK
jgi:hypothetical protein